MNQYFNTQSENNPKYMYLQHTHKAEWGAIVNIKKEQGENMCLHECFRAVRPPQLL